MLRKFAALAAALGLSLAAAHAQDADTELDIETPDIEAVADAPDGEAAGDDAQTREAAGAPSGLDAEAMIAPTYDPGPVSVVCPFRGEIDYEPGDIECGFVTVPENREREDTRAIQLLYVRIAASGDEEEDGEADEASEEDDAQAGDAAEDDTIRPDPVLYLTGGPGVGVNTYVARLKDHPITQHRDLYILEQRGIGRSGQFCDFYSETALEESYAESIEESERAQAERMRRCFEEARASGVDVSAYNTVENARDVKALREALGFEDWNIWGISYGSHLGQMVLREDPEGVRAMVLDAIVPNDLAGLMEIHRMASTVLENILATCDGARACDNLEDRFFAAIDNLQNDPLVIEVEDIEIAPEGSVWLPPALVAFIPFSMAYEQDEHPYIPATIQGIADIVETRDEAVLRGLGAGASMGGPGGLSISQGMSSAIRCNDGYFHASADVFAEDAAAHPRFAGLIGTEEGARYTAQVCEDAGLAPRDRSDYQLVEQAPAPTLIVNGAWDPVTPPWLATYIAEQMEGSRYVEAPFAGHGPTRSMQECAGQVLTDFFDTLDLEGLDASCLEEGVGEPKYVDLFQTTAPLRLAGVSEGGPEKAAPVVLWAGLSALPLVLAVLIFPLGFFGRVVDGTPVAELRAETSGARFVAFLAALAGAAGLGLMGYGAYVNGDAAPASILAGFAPPAGSGAWLLLACGLLGVISLVMLLPGAFKEPKVRIGTLLGVVLTALAAISLTVFAVMWDLAPMM